MKEFPGMKLNSYKIGILLANKILVVKGIGNQATMPVSLWNESGDENR